MVGFTIYYELRHPLVRKLLNEFNAAIKRTDDDYMSGSDTNITAAKSELIAALQAIIKQVRNQSTYEVVEIFNRLK